MSQEPESSDRLKAALEGLFALMLPKLAYWVQWEGVVLMATPGVPATSPAQPAGPMVLTKPATVNVRLTDADALGQFGQQFQNIAIPIWADAGGLISVPTIGSLVRVGFVNGSASKPYIAGLDPMTMPTVSAGVVLRTMLGVTASWPAAAAAGTLVLTGGGPIG